MFCFGSALYSTENEKFVYNNQQCFAFQIQMLTTSWHQSLHCPSTVANAMNYEATYFRTQFQNITESPELHI